MAPRPPYHQKQANQSATIQESGKRLTTQNLMMSDRLLYSEHLCGSETERATSVLDRIHTLCTRTTSIASFCSTHGIVGGDFSPNTMYESSLKDRFISSCVPGEVVAVVFHGTNVANVDSILKSGLDPSCRKRQLHGPGEYFGITPQVALQYCCGKRQLIVFAVILPAAARFGNTVVIENNDHQFPLGTLPITRCTKSRAVQPPILSYQEQQRIQEESRRVERKALCEAIDNLHSEIQLQKGMIDSTNHIVQLLMNNETSAASELFFRCKATLDEESLVQVAYFVQQTFARFGSGHEEASIYFPGLPQAGSRRQHGQRLSELEISLSQAQGNLMALLS